MELAGQIDDEIDTLKEEHQKEKEAVVAQQQVATGPHPDFVEWQGRNQWYATDEDLREFADATGLVYFNKNPGLSPQQVLKYVEEKVKKQYPDKFGVRKAAPNPVAGVGDKTTKKGPKGSDIELDDMEREIMNTLVKSGTMTEVEYKQELKKAKGL